MKHSNFAAILGSVFCGLFSLAANAVELGAQGQGGPQPAAETSEAAVTAICRCNEKNQHDAAAWAQNCAPLASKNGVGGQSPAAGSHSGNR